MGKRVRGSGQKITLSTKRGVRGGDGMSNFEHGRNRLEGFLGKVMEEVVTFCYATV